ncbi:hypothetical protein [Pseudovibrio brasiliensis]|uniref:Uncharacterized protein n=1 Tax=Pseudovibrio brasiliensis TaxID=1898042 RepID=A0ABX8AKB3_9HYPH|nr:hypothetical protein [Pseudovibrio brasiliensis]QUS55489.1 hypothetical protein KGB56_19555 [Pseudovibrio brasiliensis]
MKSYFAAFIILLFAANYQADAASVSSLLSKGKCIKLSTLLEVDMESYLENEKRYMMDRNPCDAFGLLYVLGLGLNPPPSNHFDINVGAAYQFYYFAKTYLWKKSKPANTPEYTQELNVLRSLTLTTLSDGEIEISKDRKDIYRVFLLRELFFTSKNSDAAKSGLLISFIEVYAYGIPLSTYSEVDCFIKHDIPKYSIAEIKTSPSFLHCVQNLQQEEDG